MTATNNSGGYDRDKTLATANYILKYAGKDFRYSDGEFKGGE
jgi:hypothetical protein